ncbi:MAG: S41 family peptidase [Alistipes sp.]|nr:S41 family peptidase [Alistipes sp.]
MNRFYRCGENRPYGVVRECCLRMVIGVVVIVMSWLPLSWRAVAQQRELPKLTKEQMYMDYDSLRMVLRKYWPHGEVQRLVTGYDAYGRIDELRGAIDTVTCEAGFFSVIMQMMFACNDQHVSLSWESWCREESAMTGEWSKRYNTFGYDQKRAVKYVGGRYYTLRQVDTATGEEVVPLGARLLAVGGIPIDEYASGANMRMQANTLWDWKRGKFYTVDLNDPRTIGAAERNTWTIRHGGRTRTVDLDGTRTEAEMGPNAGFRGVRYFERDGILFVRLPSMSPQLSAEICEQLQSYAGRRIDKVVIDVRGNGGGSDLAWMDLLAAITDRTIAPDCRMAFKERWRAEEIGANAERVLYGRDTLYAVAGTDKIVPSERSLRYGGKIYVIFDADRCYSSTGSLLSACAMDERLVSVGQRSGFLLGVGTTPMPGFLDHSKIVYRVPMALEVTGAREGHPEDCYMGRVDVEVPIRSFKSFYAPYYETDDDIYGEEFLYNHDACFRRILRLK